jgi:hypothetical protein
MKCGTHQGSDFDNNSRHFYVNLKTNGAQTIVYSNDEEFITDIYEKVLLILNEKEKTRVTTSNINGVWHIKYQANFSDFFKNVSSGADKVHKYLLDYLTKNDFIMHPETINKNDDSVIWRSYMFTK